MKDQSVNVSVKWFFIFNILTFYYAVHFVMVVQLNNKTS